MTVFIGTILGGLLQLVIFLIIAQAILSWLLAFDVVNYRNPIVFNIARFLDAVTGPLLRPLQKFIPSLGGVDITPIILILILQGILRGLLPALLNMLYPILG
jgi:YggT family protein